MGEKFFRFCPNCKQFFYKAEDFREHQCGQPEMNRELDHRTTLMELEGEEDVDYSAEDTAEFPNEKPTVNAEQEGRRELKAKYVAFLKKQGIDLSRERSFKKVERAYFQNGGK